MLIDKYSRLHLQKLLVIWLLFARPEDILLLRKEIKFSIKSFFLIRYWINAGMWIWILKDVARGIFTKELLACLNRKEQRKTEEVFIHFIYRWKYVVEMKNLCNIQFIQIDLFYISMWWKYAIILDV